MILNLFSISALILSITGVLLTIILVAYGRSKLHRVWALFNVAVVVWAVGIFLVSQAKSNAEAIAYWKLAHIGSLFIAVIFLHTACVFCNINRKKLLIVAYFQAILYVVLDSLNYIDYTIRILFNGSIRYIKPLGSSYLIFLGIWVLLVTYGLYELFRFHSRVKGYKKVQTFYFIVGLLVGFIGGSTHHITVIGTVLNVDIYPFGQLGVALYCIIVTYAILRYRLMDIRLFISRAAAFLISYPLFLGVPFVFAYRMQWIIYPFLGRNWWLAPSGLIVFFASLAPLAYGQLKVRMEERLLAEQKRYQKLLLRAASGMATEHNLDRLSKLIVYIVKRAVKIEFATIFIDDKANGVYRMKAFRDTQQAPYKSVTFLYEHPFIQFLAKHKEPCIYEELPFEIRKTLGSLSNASLIVPSTVQDELLGFVLLGSKLNKQPYSDDDVNVFKILSHQAALAIENSLFLEETKQAQEKIFTAEKLASIGGMADGVAHQIKNRLNQFSVASGELKYEIKDFVEKHPALTAKSKDLKKTLDYLVEIAESLIKNVKRTDGIVKGILNFARVEETSTFFSQFSLKEVIGLSSELLVIKHEIAEAPLEVNLGKSDIIYGVKSQITEAVYNLIDNAYEATQEKRTVLAKESKDGFKPLIKVKLTHKPNVDLLEISDNGIGMREADKRKVFAPFFTTKSSYKSGTGIGMYVVKRMIEENHKGRVWFNSAYMEGTKFFVELPKG